LETTQTLNKQQLLDSGKREIKGELFQLLFVSSTKAGKNLAWGRGSTSMTLDVILAWVKKNIVRGEVWGGGGRTQVCLYKHMAKHSEKKMIQEGASKIDEKRVRVHCS